MDFVDWRKAPEKNTDPTEAVQQPARAQRDRRFVDYVEEQIRQAQARGDFANLPGMGKPLPLDDYATAKEKAAAYNLLKGNHFAPPEIELTKEIDADRARAEAKLRRLIHQSKTLRSRRVPPFESEKRAFNVAVEKTTIEYEHALRELNSKILTLNISAPPALHRPTLEVEQLVEQFRTACPLFVL